MDYPAYERLDVTAWEVVSEETSGADAKYWLLDPRDESRWLFKAVTVKDGHRHGEDWAEKAAAHLAAHLSLPAAVVELAVRGDVEGCISRNLNPANFQMQPGYVVLLAAGTPGYQPGNVKGRPGHSLSNIQRVLSGVLAPPNSAVPEWMTAFDVFSGYIMLDAWIASRDRHDENWSVLYPIAGDDAPALCGSYDHAGSLGYNLRDEERQRRLDDEGGVEKWARGGTAWRLEHAIGTRPITLVQAVREAFALAGAPTAAYWLQALAAVDDGGQQAVLDRLPKLSEPARRFASSLLRVNRRRILDECHASA